jgi:nitric oxide reductase subunit B
MEALVWMRVPGDVVFGVGVFAFAAFVYQAFRGNRQALQAAQQRTT